MFKISLWSLNFKSYLLTFEKCHGQWPNCEKITKVFPIPSVQSLSRVWLFLTPWTAACQASLFITNSWSLPKLMCTEWCHPMISSSVVPYSSWLESFPASGSFPMSQFFLSGGQSIGASVSVLPVNIQDWFPLGQTGWISLQYKEPSSIFNNTV